MSDSKFCVFIDAGHGGINPSNGDYTTSPQKMWRHPGEVMHNQKGWFYEGVFNRAVALKLEHKLMDANICYERVYHHYEDWDLDYRVDFANWRSRMYERSVYISLHANAFNGRTDVEGFEVYTSPGRTNSDDIAESIYEYVQDLFGAELRYRPDRSDNDYDREARFYVLTKTVMPAVLVEHDFFDYLPAAKRLLENFTQERFAEAEFRAIVDYING